MQEKPTKIGVYIGRFQPLHSGHIKNIISIAKKSDAVIMVLGSANKPRSIDNPFTVAEREFMVAETINELSLNDHADFYFVGVEDTLYQDHEWAVRVTQAVSKKSLQIADDTEITLYGHSKEDCNYLGDFSFWKYEEMEEHSVGEMSLSATILRHFLYSGMHRAITPISGCGSLEAIDKGIREYKWLTSQTVVNFIEKFIVSDEFEQLKREHKHYIEEEKMYAGYPYAKNFLTTDAVVIQSGHILLIKRGTLPGEGLWALPGGHLNADEDALSGCLRELKEETGLKVPTKILKGSLKKVKNFDHPDRSLRCRVSTKQGRTFTVAHCFVLDNTVEKLPRVKGADDAREAWWFTLAEIRNMKDKIFEDHSDIIEYFIHQV